MSIHARESLAELKIECKVKFKENECKYSLLTSNTKDFDLISSGNEKYKDGVERNAILPPLAIRASTILSIVFSEYQYWL